MIVIFSLDWFSIQQAFRVVTDPFYINDVRLRYHALSVIDRYHSQGSKLCGTRTLQSSEITDRVDAGYRLIANPFPEAYDL